VATNSASEIKEKLYTEERLSSLVDRGCKTSLGGKTSETRRIEIDLQPVIKKRILDRSSKSKEN
jgi:hypothetical protein